MYRNILVVCVGNICRSPIGEALFRLQAIDGLQVSSAGIAAMVGEPVHDYSLKLLTDMGFDFANHKARQINQKLVREADLILVMEKNHQRQLGLMFPEVYSKVMRLGEWDNCDILDFFEKDEQAFVDAYRLIEQGVKSWLTKIKLMRTTYA